MAMPTFKFAKNSIRTTAALDKAVEETGGNKNRFFRPGNYAVKVVAVATQGAASDPTWQKVLLTLQGAGPEKITHQVMVPTETIEYVTNEGKKSLFAYQKLVNFVAGLGVTLSPENIENVVPDLFTNPEKTLTGRQMSIDVGFRGNFIDYRGKDDRGNKKYVIKLRDGTLALNGSVYADYDAAEQAALSAKIEISKFAEIVNFVAAAPSLKVANSNW